jgi:hypothetical protein
MRDQEFWYSLSSELTRLDAPSAPNLCSLSKRFSRLLHDSPAKLVIQIADNLLDSQLTRACFVAYDLIVRHPTVASSLTPLQI